MGIKHWFMLAATATLACGSAVAQPQEHARVLSVTPVLQQVGVPQQFCEDAPLYTGPRTSGSGAVIGALLGGVAGNSMGRGGHYGPRGHYHSSSRGPGTVIGAIAGGLVGHAIESAASQPRYETVRRCTEETVYEDQTVAYDVTYEHAGRRYTTRMDHDPGHWMPVHALPQGHYSSRREQAPRFVGPSGVYQSAPAGMVVTESITYTSPSPPIVIGVNAGPTYASPPPSPYYWR